MSLQQDGFLTLTRKNCGRLTDTDFYRAQKEGCLQELLDSLDTDHVHGPQHNLITQSFAIFVFQRLFNAAPVSGEWLREGGTNCAFLTGCVLSAEDSEPSITEWDPGTGDWDYWSPTASSWPSGISYKRFEEDQAELDEIKSDPHGRESIYYRERWLWAPNEAVSSNIRSFGISASMYIGNASGAESRKGKAGRIRLKDSNGLPIIYSKSSTQILLAEYKFILASV